MKTNLDIALLTAQILMCAVAWPSGMAQAQNAPAADSPVVLTVEQVVNKLVQRNIERARALTAYEGTRVYRLEYRGFPGSRSAEMIVDVKYNSPGTKRFTIRSEKGSRLIIDRVFRKLLDSEQEALTPENRAQVALNNDNYRFALAGIQNTPTGSCYILTVEPLTKNKLLYRGQVWVDASDFAVVKIEGEPAKNPSFWTKDTTVEQVYTKIGGFWLPLLNRSSSNIRLGGHADFTIDYHDYQITNPAPLDGVSAAGYQ